MSSHPYAVGVAFIAVGSLVTIGGVSGNLAPMIGALFAPSYVREVRSGSTSVQNTNPSVPYVKIGGQQFPLTGPLGIPGVG